MIMFNIKHVCDDNSLYIAIREYKPAELTQSETELAGSPTQSPYAELEIFLMTGRVYPRTSYISST